MAFNGREGSQITLSEGATMTEAYRTANPGETLAHFMGKDLIQQLLSQQGCMGIRIYHGINQNGEKEIVMVGADSHENDMLQLIADRSVPCPSACSLPNDLNS